MITSKKMLLILMTMLTNVCIITTNNAMEGSPDLAGEEIPKVYSTTEVQTEDTVEEIRPIVPEVPAQEVAFTLRSEEDFSTHYTPLGTSKISPSIQKIAQYYKEMIKNHEQQIIMQTKIQAFLDALIEYDKITTSFSNPSEGTLHMAGEILDKNLAQVESTYRELEASLVENKKSAQSHIQTLDDIQQQLKTTFMTINKDHARNIQYLIKQLSKKMPNGQESHAPLRPSFNLKVDGPALALTAGTALVNIPAALAAGSVYTAFKVYQTVRKRNAEENEEAPKAKRQR